MITYPHPCGRCGRKVIQRYHSTAGLLLCLHCAASPEMRRDVYRWYAAWVGERTFIQIPKRWPTIGMGIEGVVEP